MDKSDLKKQTVESNAATAGQSQALTPDEVYDIISLAHMEACMEFEEPMSREDLEHSFPYLTPMLEEYYQKSSARQSPAAGFVSLENEQTAFNKIIKREDIRAFFQNGMVEDEDLLKMWETSKQ